MSQAVQAPDCSIAQGAFLLPAIDSGVPARIDSSSNRARILARLALIAEQHGLSLPAGDLASVDQVVAMQWSQHTQAVYPEGLGKLLPAQPAITIDDTKLSVPIEAVGRLSCFMARPVIQELEEARKGLGWFVYNTITSAYRAGLMLYDPQIISYHMNSMFYEIDEFTDEAYAEHLLREEGREGTEVTPELIEMMRDEYSYWPSDIQKDFEGAIHITGFVSGGSLAQSSPKPLSLTGAKRWLKANADHRLSKCVNDAIAFRKSIDAKGGEAFHWKYDGDPYRPDSERIGAVAFLSWEDPSLLFEMTSEFEELAFQSGEVIEEVGRYELSIEEDPTDEQLNDLVEALNAFLKRWHLFEELMSHLPVWEGEEI